MGGVPRVRIIFCWTPTHGDTEIGYITFCLLIWVGPVGVNSHVHRTFDTCDISIIILLFLLDSHRRQRRLLNRL